MKRSRLFLPYIISAIFNIGIASGQAPLSYYQSAFHKSKFELKTALKTIIDAPLVPTYADIWKAYAQTDITPNSRIWDMYSNCTYTFANDQCGTSRVECDCYNREHAFPKSWFGNESPMNCDLHHVIPSDGYVNGRRSNYPYGEVNVATYVSSNGSQLGSSAAVGYAGTVFEPIDEYKGDLARIYFYMVTCYESQVSSWKSPMLNGTSNQAFSDWSLRLLMRWSADDPVSDKEILRNNAIYAMQGNRNPFVDYPDLVQKIWGTDTSVFVGLNPSKLAEPALKIRYAIFDSHSQVRSAEIVLGSLAPIAPNKPFENLTKVSQKARVLSPKGQEDLILLSDFTGYKSYSDNNPELSIDQLPRYKEKNKVFPAQDSIKLGTGSQVGYLITEAIDASSAHGRFVIEIAAKGWGSSEAEIQVECGSESQTMHFSAKRSEPCQIQRLTFDNGSSLTQLKISTTANKTRCFIDYIKVYAELDATQFMAVSSDTFDMGSGLIHETLSKSLNVRVFKVESPISITCSSGDVSVSPNVLTDLGSHDLTVTYQSDRAQSLRALLTFTGAGPDVVVPLKATTLSQKPTSPRLMITSPAEGHSFTDSVLSFAFSAMDLGGIEPVTSFVEDTLVYLRLLRKGTYRMVAGLYIHDTLIPYSQDTLNFSVSDDVGIKDEHTSKAWCYPNPAIERVWVLAERAGELTVFSSEGRSYHSKYLQKGVQVLDVSGWAPGAYIFRLGSQSQTIIINTN